MAAHLHNFEDNEIPQFENSGRSELWAPGFGCKLETLLPADKGFRRGLDDVTYDRLTAREVAMLHLMDATTDKHNWRMEVHDPKIIEKWRAEAMAMPLISDAAFDWCIEEMQDKSGLGDDDFIMTLDTSSRCAKGDNVVPKTVLQDLQSQVFPLLRQSKD